jgi:hypothetical protein
MRDNDIEWDDGEDGAISQICFICLIDYAALEILIASRDLDQSTMWIGATLDKNDMADQPWWMESFNGRKWLAENWDSLTRTHQIVLSDCVREVIVAAYQVYLEEHLAVYK